MYPYIEPNRVEKEEFESFFTYNSNKIPIKVHIEKTYLNYILQKTVVNIIDIRLPVKNEFLYTEVTNQGPGFNLVYEEKKIEHENPWITCLEKSDFINQIEKNNEYLNRIEHIKKNR